MRSATQSAASIALHAVVERCVATADHVGGVQIHRTVLHHIRFPPFFPLSFSKSSFLTPYFPLVFSVAIRRFPTRWLHLCLRLLCFDPNCNLQDLVYGANSGGHAISTTAHVTAVFEDTDGTEILFTRTITGKGGSEYRLNQKVVPWDKYNAKLESLDLIVKARNFLVFQGDVESIAQKSPLELAKLFENISGSDEL